MNTDVHHKNNSCIVNGGKMAYTIIISNSLINYCIIVLFNCNGIII